MQLFPAIDLRGGQVVRLTQGDYDRMTVYGQDPCAQARSFVAAGAKNLHVVDLDGAKNGTLSNYDTIAALAKQGGLYIEVGGGIRTEERIEKYLSLGVGRCILGSVAVTDFAFTARMLQKYGDKIAVGVDAKDGYVAIHGWKEVSAEPGVAFCKRLAEAGCTAIIYTDIACDGAMQGTNLSLYRQLAAQVPGVAFTASGGISSEAELLELQQNLAKTQNVIMDGRDIGTCVLPHADVKVYLTASVETRAKRRYQELQEKGEDCNLEEIAHDIEERDRRDMTREIAPLKQAEDAVLADTSGLDFDQSCQLVCDIIREKM